MPAGTPRQQARNCGLEQRGTRSTIRLGYRRGFPLSTWVPRAVRPLRRWYGQDDLLPCPLGCHSRGSGSPVVSLVGCCLRGNETPLDSRFRGNDTKGHTQRSLGSCLRRNDTEGRRDDTTAPLTRPTSQAGLSTAGGEPGCFLRQKCYHLSKITENVSCRARAFR